MKYLNQLMNDRHMTRADLSRLSGIPESTLRDILSGRAWIDRCAAGTLLRLAAALNTTIENILEHFYDECPDKPTDEREFVHSKDTIWVFYALLKATLLDLSQHRELDFVHNMYNENWIEQLFEDDHYREALFLLGLTDYLIRKNHVEPSDWYDDFRCFCLDRPVYPIRTMTADGDAFEEAKAYARKHAIPELARFNIFLSEKDITPDLVGFACPDARQTKGAKRHG